MCIASLTSEPLCFEKFRIGKVGGVPIYVVLFCRGRNCSWSPLVTRIHIVVDQHGGGALRIVDLFTLVLLVVRLKVLGARRYIKHILRLCGQV